MRRVTSLGFEGFEGANGGSIEVELIRRWVWKGWKSVYRFQGQRQYILLHVYQGCFAKYLRIAMSLNALER